MKDKDIRSPQQLDANGRLVRPDGTLFYPYIGNVEAAGKTIEELRSTIARRLTNYIDSPQVDVSILRFGSQRVIVSGAFDTAGEVPVTTAPMLNTKMVQHSSPTMPRTSEVIASGLVCCG